MCKPINEKEIKMLKRLLAICCATIICSSPIIVSHSTNQSSITYVYAAESYNSYTDAYGVTYSFTVDELDNTACLTGITNAKSNLILPSTISSNGKTYTVTKLGNGFGRRNKAIQSLTIPDTILSLGQSCFYDATNLKTIHGADYVKEVGYNSFLRTQWDFIQEEEKGFSTFKKVFFRLSNDYEKDTLDLSSSEFDNIEYISEDALGNSKKIKKLILPKNLIFISKVAITRNTESWYYNNKIEEIKFYDNSLKKYVDLYDVCMSEDRSVFQSDFLEKFYEVFYQTPLGDRITLDYTKRLLQKCDVKYIGSTENTGYTAFEEYQIVRKIYIFIAKNFTNYNSTINGSESFRTEYFDHRGIICADYARMFIYFCNAAGINCKFIESIPEGAHAWNNVKIGDKWFNVDSCASWNLSLQFFLTADNVVGCDNASHVKRSDYSDTKCTTQIGDVNHDGFIDSVDASLIMKAYCSLSSDYTSDKFSSLDLVLCDVNRDGRIDSVDVCKVLEYYSYASSLRDDNGNPIAEVPPLEKFLYEVKHYSIINTSK